MKIKDLLEFNPEADICVVFQNGLPFTGELTYGWSNNGVESQLGIDSKITATEVCIFLGDISENSGNV